MFAHAPDDEQIRKSLGQRQQAGNRVAREIDEGFIHDHEFEIGRRIHEIDHLFERDKLAGRDCRD